jgi:8-oxo-dGTP diphosphatase
VRETGLTVAAGRLLGGRVHPETGRAMTYVCCEVISGDAHVASAREVAEVRWCGAAELARLVPDLYGPVREYLDAALTDGARQLPGV